MHYTLIRCIIRKSLNLLMNFARNRASRGISGLSLFFNLLRVAAELQERTLNCRRDITKSTPKRLNPRSRSPHLIAFLRFSSTHPTCPMQKTAPSFSHPQLAKPPSTRALYLPTFSLIFLSKLMTSMPILFAAPMITMSLKSSHDFTFSAFSTA